MNKYDNALKKMGRLMVGIVIILLFTALLISPILIIAGDMMAVGEGLFLILFSFCGFFIYQGINIAFFNQEYESTGIVRDGDTVFRAKQTDSYVKRTMWFCFIEFIAHMCLAIYYFAVCAMSEYTIILAISGIVSIIIAIVYFLNAGKRKVDLDKWRKG